jgi:hypothetical protein
MMLTKILKIVSIGLVVAGLGTLDFAPSLTPHFGERASNVIIIGPGGPTTDLVPCNGHQITACRTSCRMRYADSTGSGWCSQSDDGNTVYCKCQTNAAAMAGLLTCEAEDES